jgi:ribonuclease G
MHPMVKKEILVSCQFQQKRVALLEEGQLAEYYIEQEDDSLQLVGSVFKGKVSSVIPGIGAAFVSLGLEKNGFLYVGDVIGDTLSGLDTEDLEPQESAPRRERPEKMKSRKIQDLLKVDQEVMVQVVKEPFGTKGARLTCQISLPGRYVVLMPFHSHRGISKRIEDRRERDRIREMVRSISIPDEVGLIVRTAAAGCEKASLERDIRFLLHQWKLIKRRAAVRPAPALLHEEFGIILRMIRDIFNEQFHAITIDSREEYRKAEHYMKATVPQLLKKLVFYRGDAPLFMLKNIERELEKLFESRAYLKSGGTIVIEQTEALVSIDVNTGKFVGKRNLEDTAYRTNCEAAREIAKQIRLRDLGGIIIIDFIDMESAEHRRSVIKILEESLKRDRAKTSVLNLSQLGLVEMTRQRIRKSLHTTNTQKCPYCQGRGTVKSNRRVAVEALDKASDMLKRTKQGQVEITTTPAVAELLVATERSLLRELERKHHGQVAVAVDPSLHPEDIRIKRIFDRRRQPW